MRTLAFIAAAPIAVLALAGCGSSSGSSSETGAVGATMGGGKRVDVSAQEFAFDPGTLQIHKPGTYTFVLTNNGTLEHALEVEGQGVEEELEPVTPGSSGQLTITFSKTGTYEFYCPIDGHRDKGMEGTLTIGAASAGAGTTEDNGNTGGNTGKTSGGYGYG
jgi:uncharacterized cupredoxin-like copper-binding protein